ATANSASLTGLRPLVDGLSRPRRPPAVCSGPGRGPAATGHEHVDQAVFSCGLGVRKIVADARSPAREYTAEAIEKVVAIMRNDQAPPAAVLSAAVHILDRGWGKPKESLDVAQRRSLEDLVAESYALARERDAAKAAAAVER